MCSRNCPCKASDKSNQWKAIKEEDLISFERKRDFVFTDIASVQTYDSYDACIAGVTDPSDIANRKAGNLATPQFYQFAKEFREQNDFDKIKDWIAFFENEFDCAGICKPALFSWTQSVNSGKPLSSCIGAVKDELKGSFMGLGICTLVSGILLFFIFLFQYCLWKKY